MQTRYEQAAMFPLVHVWCDYLVARKVFSSFADDKTRILCAFQNIFKEESSVQVSRRLVDNTTMLRCHRTKNVFLMEICVANDYSAVAHVCRGDYLVAGADPLVFICDQDIFVIGLMKTFLLFGAQGA
ncbi:uncharacterized protein PHALS_04418 [Plasmopara halstedii]|uniref:Uncharacterized protein n=1 Tax=Plasmopara halstedii TaxID=4781 RepID=A0A0P1B1W2_PLAHL|nr:uncharacterized protein PHALS_04418 [Plasmopara halstedii]CEG47550.1 hypothetical protein PHALS_04418 [Plasmopara halstedii]|eukprot:XP_024583919.1 hypothetical protein PHALS_04418 [Plasmopara halstedii]